jgi:hypothetical protein
MEARGRAEPDARMVAMSLSLETLVPLLVLAVVAARIPAWLARTRHLRLTIFQPYRGDPWPIGVQEDDDFRFDWTRPSRDELGDPVAVSRPARIDVRARTR